MNIEDMTLKQIKEIQSIALGTPTASTTHPLIGKNVIVRTVTMIYTGRLDHVTPQDYVLLDCSWIPETDRYMQFVENGSVRECEPFPGDLPVYINRGSLLDVCELRKNLPRNQK
jgi:hypothetical protein